MMRKEVRLDLNRMAAIATTLGFMTWTISSNIDTRRVGVNSESANAFELVKKAIRNQNGEFYIVHTGANFNVDQGEATDIFSWGESSSKTFNTSGANVNVMDLERRVKNDFCNDVTVYGKGINGEDIMSRANHATKKRTTLPITEQFDFTLGAPLSATGTLMELSQDLPTTSSWTLNDYLLIGSEVVRLATNVSAGLVSAGSNIQITRAATSVTGSVPSAHDDYSEVLYLGATKPSSILRSQTGISFNLTVALDANLTLSQWGTPPYSVFIGDEEFTVNAQNTVSKLATFTYRAVGNTDAYQHPGGSPIVLGEYDADNPDAGSSISTYGHRANKFSLSGLWNKGTADMKAESMLEAYSFPPEELTLRIADPIGTYMTSSGNTFEVDGGFVGALANTKNLNLIGHMITVNDTYSNLSSAANYRVTKESFFYDRLSGPSLTITANSITDTNYQQSSKNTIGAIFSKGSEYVEKLKNMIVSDVQETTRTSDYNKKQYSQYDGSGGLNTFTSKPVLSAEGILFTETTTVPPAINGALYAHSSDYTLYYYTDNKWYPLVLWDYDAGAVFPVVDGNEVKILSSSASYSMSMYGSDVTEGGVITTDGHLDITALNTLNLSGANSSVNITSAEWVDITLGDAAGSYYVGAIDSSGGGIVLIYSDGGIICTKKSRDSELMYTDDTNNLTTFKMISGATSTSSDSYITIYNNTNACILQNFFTHGYDLIAVRVTVDGTATTLSYTITTSPISTNVPAAMRDQVPTYLDQLSEAGALCSLPPITCHSSLKIELRLGGGNKYVAFNGWVMEVDV